MLHVQNLTVAFTVYERGLAQKRLTVITDLDVEVQAGEVVAIVGASGSGKSLLAHAILGILPHNADLGGTMTFEGEALTPARKEALRGKQIVLVPQSVASLDPLMRVGAQVQRAAQLSGQRSRAADQAVDQAFRRYSLPETTRQRYPFQLSGGMARRVLVSTAVVGSAKLVIADEPTPGLHPQIVAETLGHLRELADEGCGVLLITHDIEAALQIADRVAVFYAGTTVEMALASDFAHGATALRHPYTKALWRALPQNEFIALAGTQPNPDALPDGCLFADRCPLVTAACRVARPESRSLRGGLVRCIHAEG
ncbi:MAG: ABC transporter ATP-binding protein [Roseiflexaceae bacterium]|nr:ABC transporter ATP-binding protein [Roseiflexaceae bacterium]